MKREPTKRERAHIARMHAEEGEPATCPTWLKVAGGVALAAAAIAGACALSGCASVDFAQPPAELAAIHNAAKARIEYRNYAAKDYRWIEPGTVGAGNCATFAFTVTVDAIAAGMSPEPVTLCRLPDGTGHAFARVGDWVSDVRFSHLIRAGEEDCK